jgi:hypothetical protein
MTTGTFLTIGLNAVDPAGYQGWDGVLNACENDARDMAAIAARSGFTGATLLTAQATSSGVLAEMYKAAQSLAPGDILVIGYSGHGGQVGDVTADEPDSLDETWCLYDRMMVDDELYALWAQFRPGVRIVVLSDSCHSGTVVKMAKYASFAKLGLANGDAVSAEGKSQEFRPKAIPFGNAWDLYQGNKAMYDSLQYVAGPSEKAAISASVILISGCQDNQLSLDGAQNGVFTGTLKRTWNDGKFSRNYAGFRDDIAKVMPPSQTPNYFVVGAPNLAFEAQKPFTL